MQNRSYRDLVVWQKAMDVAVEVYRLAARLPRAEIFGLRAQLTRAAASVPANIAEGKARSGAREFAHFLSIARGSLAETETFLVLATRLGYLAEAPVASVLTATNEIERMLTTLYRRLT